MSARDSSRVRFMKVGGKATDESLPPSNLIYDANGHISREMRGKIEAKKHVDYFNGSGQQICNKCGCVATINATQLCKKCSTLQCKRCGRDFRPTIRSIGNPYCTYCKGKKREWSKRVFGLSVCFQLRFHFLRACRSTILGNESGCLKSIKLHSSSLSLLQRMP